MRKKLLSKTRGSFGKDHLLWHSLTGAHLRGLMLIRAAPDPTWRWGETGFRCHGRE